MQQWRQGVRVAATVVGIGTLAYVVSHGPWLIVEPTSALKPNDRANLASINTYVFGWGISITIGAMSPRSEEEGQMLALAPMVTAPERNTPGAM
jgi:hypothetical protein